MYHKTDHTFVIPAYKESPYLEECILSLTEQNMKTNIIITTSTPNDHITKLAVKYNLMIKETNSRSSIGRDFNFAYNAADTELVTIAHQDDVYYSNYTKTVLENINKFNKPLFFFCEYDEFRNNKTVSNNLILNVKRFLNLPFRFKKLSSSIKTRRIVLAFGNSICCPSVCYVKKNLDDFSFNEKLLNALDYEAWEKISRLEGNFVYSKEKLMFHRIHEDSQTTKTISGSIRTKEEIAVFSRFWPKPLVKIISKIYSLAQKSN